jgi:hypothetical protein
MQTNTLKLGLFKRRLRGDMICWVPLITVTEKGVSSELSFNFKTLHFPSSYFFNLINK